MSMQIDTCGYIKIGGQDTGLKVGQRREGTFVYTPESGLHKYQEHSLPHGRYLLGSDSPITKPGVATRAQFEADILALLETLK